MLSPNTNDPSIHPSFDAVIWDYDGTLVETRFADELAVRRIVAREPATEGGSEVFWATEGQPILQRIELAWPGRGLELLPIFEEPCAPRVFPGIARTVRALHRRGFGLAVVSSRQRSTLEWGLETTGLRELFTRVIGLDDVHEAKPSPEGLQMALEALAVPSARAVYVGDSELDIEAGHRAGMVAWRATWAVPALSPTGAPEVRTPLQVLERLDGLADEQPAADTA